ncbi:MAG: hypothetical protein RSA86_00400 [Christensenellaceae bacterium]
MLNKAAPPPQLRTAAKKEFVFAKVSSDFSLLFVLSDIIPKSQDIL